MKTPQYSAPAPRSLVVAVGIVVTAIGLPLVAVFFFALYRLLTHDLASSDAAVALSVSGVLGFGLSVVGLRLLTGRSRRDGGLLSPWVLRFGGIILLLGPVAAVFNRSWYHLLEAGISLSGAIACFALANRREQAAAESASPNNRWRGP